MPDPTSSKVFKVTHRFQDLTGLYRKVNLNALEQVWRQRSFTPAGLCSGPPRRCPPKASSKGLLQSELVSAKPPITAMRTCFCAALCTQEPAHSCAQPLQTKTESLDFPLKFPGLSVGG